MAIFNGAPPAYQTTTASGVSLGGTTPVALYNGGSATVITSAGTSTYAFPTGSTLNNLTMVNTGTATVYLGAGSVIGTASAACGLALLPGWQVTIQGSVAAGTTSTFNIYGCTAAGLTGSVEASLATVVAVD